MSYKTLAEHSFRSVMSRVGGLNKYAELQFVPQLTKAELHKYSLLQQPGAKVNDGKEYQKQQCALQEMPRECHKNTDSLGLVIVNVKNEASWQSAVGAPSKTLI